MRNFKQHFQTILANRNSLMLSSGLF